MKLPREYLTTFFSQFSAVQYISEIINLLCTNLGMKDGPNYYL
jgi:hypothetical protein